jgi:cobalt-zinc-cadmium resistance protein CzcA
MKHPMNQFYLAQTNILQKEKEVNMARALPDISFGYFNQTLVGMHSVDGITEKQFFASDRFQSGQMSLDIPLFYGSYRRKRQIIEISQEQNELNAQYAFNELQTQFDRELLNYKGLLHSMELFETQLIPQTLIMKEQANVMLQSGEISMIEYLQTKQSVSEIEMSFLNVKHEINRSVHKLNWIIKNEN